MGIPPIWALFFESYSEWPDLRDAHDKAPAKFMGHLGARIINAKVSLTADQAT